MRLHSTKTPSYRVSLREAVLAGLPPDNGLFMPDVIPALPDAFIRRVTSRPSAPPSFPEIAFVAAHTLMGDEMPAAELQALVEDAFPFPTPLTAVDADRYALELWHGPSLAFKDVGARFMARLVRWFTRHEDRERTVLVATSGDTGGAVAMGFHNVPGIRVVILYPQGRVSDWQERQLTCLGGNVSAIAVQGTFDDCQALVKQAFLDRELADKHGLTSANSINIARLIPQSFYYIEAVKQLPENSASPIICVPSGNFGNLTAGTMAWRMGLPVAKFVAATNANDTVPRYLHTGQYAPAPTQPTLSNAMDVSVPSNLPRLLALFGNDLDALRTQVASAAVSDAVTEAVMRDLYTRTGRISEPHGAVGYHALQQAQAALPGHPGIYLETAHPAKFEPDVARILGVSVPIPDSLRALEGLPSHKTVLPVDFEQLKEWLEG